MLLVVFHIGVIVGFHLTVLCPDLDVQQSDEEFRRLKEVGVELWIDGVGRAVTDVHTEIGGQ